MFATQEKSIQITAPVTGAQQLILSEEALRFLARLARSVEPRRRQLLDDRERRQQEIDAGALPEFLPATARIRAREWYVAPIPADLQDRRVEITGPVDRKMIINALNSGANVFMADFEDSNSPTWGNVMQGQVNLRDAVRGVITYTSPEGKRYELCETPAVLMVRPRGWHLVEKHVLVDGEPISASLFDFGLFFFHNARTLIANGTGPYFYLPKMESHLEARLWNEVFILAQQELGISRGTIRATALIETIFAAFEMDEILWELREHSAGLNCGRWDYIFSFIKKFRNHSGFVLPDRVQVGMDRHFLRSYADLLIHTCHRRGAHAMGGMAAQIPIKNDPEANAAALEKVRLDKLREVWAGHDGTWVAHPALVSLARDVFDTYMPFPNQIDKKTSIDVNPADLLTVPTGEITLEGLSRNIDIGLQYLTTWLCGNGCVPIYNLMEDAATAEISRAQVWQWLTHGAHLSNGQRVTPVLVRETLEHHRRRLESQFPARELSHAVRLFETLIINPEFTDFLTAPAYDLLDA
uniref:Malate synthase n=1 Tax=Solibacter usitatus (strain Ellin6076) TaxID=234267 RepID=Q01UM1_SOLUE